MKALVFASILWLVILVATSELLTGVHLKVVIAKSPMLMEPIIIGGKVVDYDGMLFHLLEWLKQSLNFTYDMTIMKEFEYGYDKGNGTYNGFYGYLQRKESDIAFAPFDYANDPLSFVEMSQVWNTFDHAILIPSPVEQSKTWAAVKPFHAEVWFSFLAAFFFVGASMVFVQKFQREVLRYDKSSIGVTYNGMFMYLLQTFTGQDGHLIDKGFILQLIASIWCLTSVVFVSAYSGLLISFLSTTKLVPLAETVPELAEKIGTFPLYSFKGSAPDVTFTEAENGPYKAIGNYLKTHPEMRKINGPTCLKAAAENKGACIEGTFFVERFINDDLNRTKKCHFSRSQSTFLPINVGILFQKNNNYSRIINKAIMRARETGDMHHSLYEQFNQPKKCLQREEQKVKNRPLKLTDMTSPLLIYAIGCIASFLAFVGENLFAFKVKSKK